MSQKSGVCLTEKQGYYLAFIHTYSHMFGQPPAEADIQRHFRVSPPSVHQMIVTSNGTALFAVSPASREASRFSCHPKTCPSSNGSVSKRQNHCDEPLANLRQNSFLDRLDLQRQIFRVDAAL